MNLGPPAQSAGFISAYHLSRSADRTSAILEGFIVRKNRSPQQSRAAMHSGFLLCMVPYIIVPTRDSFVGKR
jgi:hypothetical protein